MKKIIGFLNATNNRAVFFGIKIIFAKPTYEDYYDARILYRDSLGVILLVDKSIYQGIKEKRTYGDLNLLKLNPLSRFDYSGIEKIEDYPKYLIYDYPMLMIRENSSQKGYYILDYDLRVILNYLSGLIKVSISS